MGYLQILNFFKSKWKIIAIIIGCIFVYLYFQNQQSTFADKFQKMQETHQATLKVIEVARVEEEKKHRDNERLLQNSLLQIESHYKEQIKTLATKRKAETEQIANKYQDDPVALSQKFSELTGFKIVLPE
jgi:uncharacterized transporter YbjL